MFQAERSERILEILKSKKNVSMQYLCETLFCSVATIRRDLIELEKLGLVKRSRGGVSLVTGGNVEYAYSFREMENKELKTYIASLTEDFISNGQAIFLDSSSTALNICPLLSKYNNITVVTNGIATALSLNEMGSVDTYITGGHMFMDSNSAVGEWTGDFLDHFKADLAILSCSGLDAAGVYEATQEQARVKQHMIQNARSTILMCDSSKIGRSYFYRTDDFQKVDAIITDRKPENDLIEAINAHNCEILY